MDKHWKNRFRVVTDADNFLPSDFRVYNFYGKETCFCWNGDRLIFFPYDTCVDTSSSTSVIAPAPIKNIECFSERIFIVCSPCGIYKLSQAGDFFTLSKTAIGIGRVYYEVLIPKNDRLYLDSKQDKSSTLLFQLSSKDEVNGLQFYTLRAESLNNALRRRLVDDNTKEEEHGDLVSKKSYGNLSIIANGKKLLLLGDNFVKIMYHSKYTIIDIKPVMVCEKIGGLLLTLGNTQRCILLHCNNQTEDIMFTKIQPAQEVCAICGILRDTPLSTLQIIYSNSTSTNLMEQDLLSGKAEETKISDDTFISVQYYKQSLMLGLTCDKELIEIPLEHLADNTTFQKDTFQKLEHNMFKGRQDVIDEICERTKILRSLNETWQLLQGELRRINLSVYQRKLKVSPRIFTVALLRRFILGIDFPTALPVQARVIVSVDSNCQKLYCIKLVDSPNMRAEIEIPEDNRTCVNGIYMDIVTFLPDGGPWCLIRKFIDDPLETEAKKLCLGGNLHTFLSAKLATLKRLIAEDSIDIEGLISMKKSIRQEVPDARAPRDAEVRQFFTGD